MRGAIMRDLATALLKCGVLGVPGVPPQKSAVFSEHRAKFAVFQGVPDGVPAAPEHLAEHREHLAEHRNTGKKPSNFNAEHREHREHLKKGGSDLEWRAKLASLDRENPPPMIDPKRWRTLIDDARWIADTHGKAAAVFGWTAAQLFGIDGAQGWGGLADRIDEARRLALTADAARWRNEQEDGKLWRIGCKGGVPIWEIVEHG